MIASYNRRQTILGCINLIAGLLALAAAAVFFYGVASFVLSRFGVDNAKPISIAFSAAALLIVFISGIHLQRKGKGNYGYQDGDLMPKWEMVSGGSFAVDFYRNRITAPAHALNQLFLCAPLQLIKGIGRLRSRLNPDRALEQRLVALLADINAKDKWETLDDYPQQIQELQYLIRMEKIQFSPRTGKLRSKK